MTVTPLGLPPAVEPAGLFAVPPAAGDFTAVLAAVLGASAASASVAAPAPGKDPADVLPGRSPETPEEDSTDEGESLVAPALPSPVLPALQVLAVAPAALATPEGGAVTAETQTVTRQPVATPADVSAPTPREAAEPAPPGAQASGGTDSPATQLPAPPRPATVDGPVPGAAAPAQPAPLLSAPPAAAPRPSSETGTVHQVRGLVFPEVAALARRGEGVHRIVLTLRPESLGQVRVVMSVRDGAVDVQLAGGSEAREALRGGEHELRRLLENAGAGASRVLVREPGELAGAWPVTDQRSTAPAVSTADAPDAASYGAPQDQRPGGRDHERPAAGPERFAPDGRPRPAATAATTTTPATRSRAAGLDVTI